MTDSQAARAVITGSYILFMINVLLEPSQRSKGSVINLKQRLFTKTRNASYAGYVILSNKAWDDTIDVFKDTGDSIVIFDAVETLVFNEEDSMKAMFGDDILDIVGRFSMKQSRNGVTKDLLAQSRRISDQLTKSMKKVVYDTLKEAA